MTVAPLGPRPRSHGTGLRTGFTDAAFQGESSSHSRPNRRTVSMRDREFARLDGPHNERPFLPVLSFQEELNQPSDTRRRL